MEKKTEKKQEQKKHANVYEALAAFQEECPSFIKNIEGYGYTYTGLPEIIQTITPILRKHGLLLLQRNISDTTQIGVETRLYHVDSGTELRSEFITPLAELKGMNIYQSAGSAITYARRYDMSTLLGLISEKDDDGGTGRQSVKYSEKEDAKSVQKTTPKKKKLEKGTKEWDAVEKWLKGGGRIDYVYKKFDLTEEQKTELVGIMNEANKKKQQEKSEKNG